MHKHYKISKCCHSDLFRDFLEPISILLVKVIIVYGKPYSLASVSVLQQSFSKKTLLTMTIFRASTDQWPILNQHIFTFWKFWEEVSGKFKIRKRSSIVTFKRDLFYVFGVKIIAFTTSLLFMFIVIEHFLVVRPCVFFSFTLDFFVASCPVIYSSFFLKDNWYTESNFSKPWRKHSKHFEIPVSFHLLLVWYFYVF